MKTVVYADVYFILNFSIDLICLALCGAIAGKPRKKVRLLLASMLGGIYACLALFITYPIISAISAIVICFLMYFISFAPRSVGAELYGGILLFCVNALFGGLYSGLVSIASGGRVDTDRFRFYPLFLTLTAVLVFIRVLNFRSVSGCVMARIKYRDRTAVFNSIIDTANSLREPISGVGVALISEDAAKRLFNDEELNALCSECDMSSAYSNGYRYVFMSTATGNRKCSCVKAESAQINQGKKKTEVSLYLAVSHELYLGDTECLLPNCLNLDL